MTTPNARRLSVAASLAVPLLSGCEPHQVPDDVDTYQTEQVAQQDALKQLNSDTEASHKILEVLKGQDPRVTDAYFKLNQQGERTLVVSRLRPDGQMETWEAPASDLRTIETGVAQQQQAQATASPQGESSVTGNGSAALLGALAGYMLANSFNSSRGLTSYHAPADYARERERSRSAYSSSVVGQSRRNAYEASVRNSRSAASGNSSSGSRSASVGRSQGGSFASSGSRSGGYASGGS